MPRRCRSLVAFFSLTLIAAAIPALAEPLFTLSEDGRTFLYRARPGDLPSVVAEMFGIPPRDVPAFLAANGITDPTRVGAGFTYRIPNAAARDLGERADALARDKSSLEHSIAEDREHVRALERSNEESRSAAGQAEARAARLARLDRLWPWAKLVVVVLVLVAAGAFYSAVAAIRRQGQADRYARTLAQDLEDKRRTALTERQESAKRILDLETRVRSLEAQLGPRVVVGGRGGS